MQPIAAADMAETIARARSKAGRRRRSMEMKETASAALFGFEGFKWQETSGNLYGKSADFPEKEVLEAVRMDSAGICWSKLLGFEFFEL